MSTSPSTATVSPPATNGRSDKSSKETKIVTLKLSSSILSRFAPKPVSRKNSKVKSSSSSASTPAVPAPTSSTDNASESASTPGPTTNLPPPHLPEGTKKKGLPGPRPGAKRSLGQADALPKPRGKPGPKKKPRLDDGTIDHNVKTTFGGIPPLPTHKLGPKANQGAINAGLRALDRSGKPCRKWEKKPFQLKSFTGVVWQLPSWRSPQTSKGDETINGANGVMTPGESDSKANNSSSAIESEKSNPGDGVDITALASNSMSSPAPAPPAKTEIAAQS